MSKAKERQRVKARTCLEAYANVRYDSIQNRVAGYGKPRYKGIDICSREDFVRWAIKNEDLKSLHNKWSSEGFKRGLTPSIDRIDSTKGYVKGNMRWLSQSENSRLGGKMNKLTRKAVVLGL